MGLSISSLIFGIILQAVPTVLALVEIPGFSDTAKQWSFLGGGMLFSFIGMGSLITAAVNDKGAGLWGLYWISIAAVMINWFSYLVKFNKDEQGNNIPNEDIKPLMHWVVTGISFVILLIGSISTTKKRKNIIYDPLTPEEEKMLEDCVTKFGGPDVVFDIAEILDVESRDNMSAPQMCEGIVRELRTIGTLNAGQELAIKQLFQKIDDNKFRDALVRRMPEQRRSLGSRSSLLGRRGSSGSIGSVGRRESSGSSEKRGLFGRRKSSKNLFG